MGSSKKHKEKDREHKRKRKHRSRDRSRSGSRERRHRDRDGKDRERHGEKRRRLESDGDEQLVRVPSHVEYGDVAAASVRSPSPVAAKRAASDEEDASGGANLSLSIQQTNELRAKLGLKPLEVTDSVGSNQDGSSNEKQDVHKPAVNLAAVKKTADLRDKMEVLREKRRVQDNLNKVKTLGADSDDDDSAAAWVLKSRKLDDERKQAEQRAKMLEEMDAEFGIGGLIEQEFGAKKKQEYSSKDLKGLKVEHDQEMFKEGKTVILTLKDKAILDEDADDTLINVNIIDEERAAKNVENKKKKPDYQPYDQDEFDTDGMLKTKEILDKYDEVIHGQKKESFELGDAGRYNTIYERNMKEMKASLAAQSERLELPPLVVANEYYTPAEMEAQNKFKKTTRKARKIRKKERVTADDLIGLEETAAEDLGSRKKARLDNGVVKEELEIKSEPAIPGLDFINEDESDLTADDILGPSEDLTGVVVDEDTAALELELALNKARRLNQNKNVKRSNERDMIASLRADIVDSTPDLASSISINSTSEFCRSLGDIPTYGQSGNRAYDEEEEMMEYDKDQAGSQHGQDDDDEQGGGTGWQSVEIDSRPVDLAHLPESSVLDEEPVVKHGLAGALLLARKKGYLDQEIVQKTAALNPTVADLHAQNYSIEDKKIDDDDKYRKRDRYIGTGGMEFREKEGYKPEIKLDYVDDGGRTMTPKEAFRMLSHRFHGKGSGKKKTEKRMKKIEEDQLMRSMSSTDTPLNTVHLLQEKQKADKVPYIVLSGGKGLASNSIAK